MQGVDFLELYALYWKKYDKGIVRVHDLCYYVSRIMKREYNWRSFEESHPFLVKDLGNRPLQISEVPIVILFRITHEPTFRLRALFGVFICSARLKSSSSMLYGPNLSRRVTQTTSGLLTTLLS